MTGHLPLFSVVIPTRGRLQPLGSCLEALAAQAYPRERFEVIVVDDGSSTSPAEVVARFFGRLRIALVEQQWAGPAMARNRGVGQAQGEFVAFTDDDCMPARDWLRRLAARFSAQPECIVGGRTANILAANPYAVASQLLQDYLFAHYDADPHRARFLTTSNLALSAQRFRALGGFSRAYVRSAAEDRDLCDQCLQAGWPMVFAPEVLVYHAHELTLGTFWRQHYSYGRGAFIFHRMHAQRSGRQVRLEPPAFYLKLIAAALAPGRGRRLQLAALLVLSQAANAAGYFRQRLEWGGGGAGQAVQRAPGRGVERS